MENISEGELPFKNYQKPNILELMAEPVLDSCPGAFHYVILPLTFLYLFHNTQKLNRKLQFKPLIL